MSIIPDQSGGESLALTFQLHATDPQNSVLTFSCYNNCPIGLSVNGASGAVTWTPNYGQAGSYHVTFLVTNAANLTNQQNANVVISHTNRPPVVTAIASQTVAEAQSLTLTPAATDPDNDATTIAVSGSLPSGASFSNGKLSWTPAYNQQGSYTVSFVATDSNGANSTPQAVSITVTRVNVPPTLAAIPNQSVAGNGTMTLALSASANDPNGDTLQYSASGLPTGATLDANSGVLTWSPDCATQNNSNYPVTFTVTDPTNGLSASQSTWLGVTHTNCYPPSWQTDPGDTYISYTQSKVTFGTAIDPDGMGVSYHWVAQYWCTSITPVQNDHTPLTVTTSSASSGYVTVTASQSTTNYFVVYAEDGDGSISYRRFPVVYNTGNTNPWTSSVAAGTVLGSSYDPTNWCGPGENLNQR